ncbi:unnamed protein product [Boreogadus saida]
MKGEVHLHYSAIEEPWCRPPQSRSWVGGLLQLSITLSELWKQNKSETLSLVVPQQGLPSPHGTSPVRTRTPVDPQQGLPSPHGTSPVRTRTPVDPQQGLPSPHGTSPVRTRTPVDPTAGSTQSTWYQPG